MFKKPIIVFEGIEGSGKSHHILNLTKFFDKKNIKYLKIREPGGSLNSEKIRKLILNNKSDFNNYTDLLLYMASRSENIKLIKKFHKKKVIIIDRFIDSTVAYQHYGMGINLNLINLINQFLLKEIKVDFTFLNLVNKKNLLLRLKKRKTLNRYDQFDLKFYDKVQKGFLKIANLKKKSYFLIDSNLEIEKNEDIVINQVQKLIK
jgi:dTMP kinase